MNPAYLACGGWTAAAVRVAARLGIADLLADHPRTPEDLAATTGADATALTCVLRLLAEVGVFTDAGAGRFTNSTDSECLRRDHPRSVRSFCLLAAGTYQQAFHALDSAVTTGRPATGAAFGHDLYTRLSLHPEEGRVYDEAMDDLARPAALVVAARQEFDRVGTVVDVGGGRGSLVLAILRAHSRVRGVCVDRADVCARATEALSAAEPALLGRVEFVASDILSHVPAGGDRYLLKNVLHNWNDESAGRILDAVASAMRGTDARLLVIESLSDGPMPPLYRALDALLQVVICEAGSVARDEAGLRSLVERHGFEVFDVERLSSGHSLFTAGV